MKLTPERIDAAARLLVFVRCARNLNIGPHPIRAAAIDAEDDLSVFLGKEMERVYKSKAWISPKYPPGLI